MGTKHKLITNALKKQVCIWEYEKRWLRDVIKEQYDITKSFNNCIAIMFGEEPKKIYDKEWNMFEVTCKRAEKPLFVTEERVQLYD